MSIDRARVHLALYGVEGRIQEFSVSSATVELAAMAIGCSPAHIAKTLSFIYGEGCILLVAAGDARIDNSKFKKQFGIRPKMLQAEDALRMTGHAVGGVCPFGINEGVLVYTDISLQRFASVYPACGSSNSAIKLTCQELYECSCSKAWVDVCKGWEP